MKVVVAVLVVIVLGLLGFILFRPQAGPAEQAMRALAVLTQDLGQTRREAKEYRREQADLEKRERDLESELSVARQRIDRASRREAKLKTAALQAEERWPDRPFLYQLK